MGKILETKGFARTDGPRDGNGSSFPTGVDAGMEQKIPTVLDDWIFIYTNRIAG